MQHEINTATLSTKDVLREILLKRMKQSPGYTAKAFAQEIGVSPAFVTMLLNGKKKISLTRAIEVTKVLHLEDLDKNMLLQASMIENGLDIQVRNRVDKSAYIDLTEEQFKVIADWYHFAILDLTTTANFQSNSQWIARKLGLRLLEVDVAIARLLNVGLLHEVNGRLEKTHKKIDLPTNMSTAAVREHHRQMMDRAKLQLNNTDQTSFEERMICSVTFAADPQRVTEARRKVLEFQQELAQYLNAGSECTTVYQLNIQLFPHAKDNS